MCVCVCVCVCVVFPYFPSFFVSSLHLLLPEAKKKKGRKEGKHAIAFVLSRREETRESTDCAQHGPPARGDGARCVCVRALTREKRTRNQGGGGKKLEGADWTDTCETLRASGVNHRAGKKKINKRRQEGGGRRY